MKAYIRNDLNKAPENFILTGLWFADKDADLTQYPPKGYMCLTGTLCHTHILDDGAYNMYDTLWDGVSLHDGSTLYKEINTYSELQNLIRDKIIVDVSGCLDGSYINNENDMFDTQIYDITFDFSGLKTKLNEEQFIGKQYIINR